MVNWEMFNPRNLFIVAAFSVLGYFIFNHFSKVTEAA